MTIDINVLDIATIDQARNRITDYIADIEEKATELCNRLATIGAIRASLDFSRAIYNGENDVTVSVEPIENGVAIHARGGAVLFIEFGAGATYGYGHPRPEEYGPGTYNPSSNRWQNPGGWWFGNSEHTYGNPPAQAMYNAEQECIRNVEQVAREVFGE